MQEVVDRNRLAVVAKAIETNLPVLIREQAVALSAQFVLAKRIAALHVAAEMRAGRPPQRHRQAKRCSV